MGAIAGTIPNLIGGVSQRPSDIRPLNTAASLLNTWLSPSLGLVTRPNSEYIGSHTGTVGSDDYIAQHNINKPSGSYQVNVIDGVLKVMNTATGALDTVNTTAGALAYLQSGTDARDLGFVTVADTTFIYNKSVTPTATTAAESGYTGQTEDSVVRLNPNLYATVWLKQRMTGDNYYSVYVNNTLEADYNTSTATPTAIVTDLLSDLNAGSAVDSATRHGSTHTIMSIKLLLEADFVEAVGPGTNASMTEFNDKVDEFADITNSDLPGRMVIVGNDDDDAADDYWVWMKEGKWEETYGWGSKETPDASTMPIVLIDNLDGTWDLQEHTWEGRQAGDTDSNPTPTFIGTPINEMFIYKGRMCVLAGENFMASQVSGFENFYRTTTQQLLDDDPINIAAPDSRGATMNHSKEFNETLLLFTEFDQFIVAGDADGLFSPNTASIKRANSYNCSKDVKPVFSGPNVLFVDDFGNRNFAALREYQLDPQQRKQVAPAITDGVPEYIPSGVYKMASTPTDNLVVVVTEGERNAAFVYHYYYNADGKVQAAWNKWTFEGDIYNIDFEGDKLLLTMVYESEVTVQGVIFHLNVDEVLSDKSVLLDQRQHSDDLVAATFDGDDSTVTTLIDGITDKTVLVVSPEDTSGNLAPGQLIIPTTVSGTTLTFNDVDVSGVDFLVGNTIDTDWLLNPLYLRDKNQVAIQDSRVQLRSLSLLYSNSANFAVTTTAPSRDPRVASYTGMTIGDGNDELGSQSLNSGEFRVAAYGEIDKINIRVTSTSPWRVRFTSIEWGGSYRPKRKRV